MDEHLPTLRMIALRSNSAVSAALNAIRAIQIDAPIARRRAAKAATLALSDTSASWTEDERTDIIAIIGHDTGELRTEITQFRTSKAEKLQIIAAAKAAGMNQSIFIRSRLGLEEE